MQIPKNPLALYLSHGAGPLPMLGDTGHKELVEALSVIATSIKKPSAMVVISAHWEDKVAAVTHQVRPPMIYDYHGFPKEAYEFQYPAPGALELAERVYAALNANRIETRLDAQRGFDHGLYIPMMLMYPNADIPCMQVSLLNSLNPAAHIRIGEALSEVAKDGVLIVGSGFSFHNMAAFFAKDTPESRAMNQSFENWLIDTCTSHTIDEEERFDRLVHWEDAPSARYCHPREEHLLPLHVCFGAAKRPASAVLQLSIINKKASMYLW